MVKESPFKRNGEVVVQGRNPNVVRERDRRLVETRRRGCSRRPSHICAM
jgi:hypothetical protein